MRDPASSTWTFYEEAAAPPAEVLIDTADALSDPLVEDLLPGALAAYLPRGGAWGTPDGQAARHDTILAGAMRVFMAHFAALHAKVYGLAIESRALSAEQLLPEWEGDFGLPDPCLGEAVQTTDERKVELLRRVRSEGVIGPQDFVQLAHRHGYQVTLEERFAFRCGFSRIGGQHFLGSPNQEAYWKVRVYGLTKLYFRCGHSRCGKDPLFQALDADRLICLFDRYAPGWTKPIYKFPDGDYPQP